MFSAINVLLALAATTVRNKRGRFAPCCLRISCTLLWTPTLHPGALTLHRAAAVPSPTAPYVPRQGCSANLTSAGQVSLAAADDGTLFGLRDVMCVVGRDNRMLSAFTATAVSEASQLAHAGLACPALSRMTQVRGRNPAADD